MCYSYAVARWIIVLVLGAQQGEVPPRGPARAPREVVAKLRAESARLQGGHASEFFKGLVESTRSDRREDHSSEFIRAWIESGWSDKYAGVTSRSGAAGEPSDPMPFDSGAFMRESGTPVRLIEDADRAASDALRFWLGRALSRPSDPPTWEQWQQVRELVVGHAEAIVLEGVLGPNQSRRWRDRASRPSIGPLAGRYSIIPTLPSPWADPKGYTRGAYFAAIYEQQFELRSSPLFAVLLGHVPPDWTNMFGEKLKPSQLRRFPGLSPEQVRLLEDLELLARRVRRYWWLRDVEVPPAPRVPDPKGIRDLPPTPRMELRLSDRGKRVRASIVAHAEEIALRAILTPEEAEPVKRQLWRERGVHALLDPELAARLHMSKSQHVELVESLRVRPEVLNKMNFGVIDYSDGRDRGATPGSMPVSEYKRHVANLDQPIWEILNPSQLRALARLLDQPVAGYAPPKPKPDAKRPGREG